MSTNAECKVMHNKTLTVMEVYEYLMEKAQALHENGCDEEACNIYYIAGLLEKTEQVNPKD